LGVKLLKEKDKDLLIALELFAIIILSAWAIIPLIYHESSNFESSASPEEEEVDVLADVENILPIVEISSDITSGKAPLEVNFKAITSDEDGKIVSYSWDFDDGKKSDKKDPTHVFEKIGTYDVILTVKDDKAGKSRDTIKIRVIENNPPKADATYYTTRLFFNQTAPMVVYFKGSGTDEDGDIVSYHWEFGPNHLSIVPYYPFRNWRDSDDVPFYWSSYESDEQDPIRILYQPGYYWAKLTVTDDDGATDTDTVNIYMYNFMSTVKETFKKMVYNN
jgi:PKD repeat protein